MTYKCKYRRNNKERYWEVKELKGLWEFQSLLEKVFENTTEQRLEIIIELNKLKELGEK
jgi:hypothetical protein